MKTSASRTQQILYILCLLCTKHLCGSWVLVLPHFFILTFFFKCYHEVLVCTYNPNFHITHFTKVILTFKNCKLAKLTLPQHLDNQLFLLEKTCTVQLLNLKRTAKRHMNKELHYYFILEEAFMTNEETWQGPEFSPPSNFRNKILQDYSNIIHMSYYFY